MDKIFQVIVVSLAAITANGAVDAAQENAGTLRIKIMLVDSQLNVKPVPKHALLVKTRDAIGEFRKLVTGFDGIVEASLDPGEYVVESEKPVEFQGKTYRWSQAVIVRALRESLLELSVDSAIVDSIGLRTGSADLPALFREWQDSVVTVWSETGRGSGFLIDQRGLIATNQHVIGTSEYAAVQLNPGLKVPARILLVNPTKDVAILWIDPKVVEGTRPVHLGYSEGGRLPAVEGQPVFTIGSPLNQRKVMTSGIVSRIEPKAIISDVNINHGNSGGPLFTTDGIVIGITTFGDFTSSGGPGISGIVRIDEARAEIVQAETAMAGGAAPAGTPLPVEPLQAFPVDGLRSTVESREVKLKDYQLKTSDFDLTFITPVLLYGAQYEAERENLKERAKRNNKAGAVRDSIQTFEGFKNWAEYVGEFKPVLMIRATPKLVEGFWSGVGRGLAASQGYYAGPANLRFKADFYKMRVFCGEAEVVPIHPSKIEHRVAVSNASIRVNDATYEGLYMFAPDAIGPHCGKVRMELFTEKEPLTPKAVELAAKSTEWLWRDFAAFRALASPR